MGGLICALVLIAKAPDGWEDKTPGLIFPHPLHPITPCTQALDRKVHVSRHGGGTAWQGSCAAVGDLRRSSSGR